MTGYKFHISKAQPMKHIPTRFRETARGRRQQRQRDAKFPQFVGLEGLWTGRVVRLKRRRRWWSRGEQRHERHPKMSTGTIGGRSRALDVLHFEPTDDLDAAKWSRIFFGSASLPPEMIGTGRP